MSNVMSFRMRLTLENAIALNEFSPLMSRKAAIVEKSRARSWFRDMAGVYRKRYVPSRMHVLRLVRTTPSRVPLRAAAVVGVAVSVSITVIGVGCGDGPEPKSGPAGK